MEPDRFARALARFDAANAQDPHLETVSGVAQPRELVYAERMSAMLDRFAPGASEPLRLAARCQHLERWRIPRAGYPQDRSGYLKWRKELNAFHARRASEMLREEGYDESTIGRVAALLRKQGLKTDPESQLLEDVVALVFFESYLADFVATHADYEHAKFADILRKTARKMSVRGRAAALELVALPPALAPLVRAAVDPIEPSKS